MQHHLCCLGSVGEQVQPYLYKLHNNKYWVVKGFALKINVSIIIRIKKSVIKPRDFSLSRIGFSQVSFAFYQNLYLLITDYLPIIIFENFHVLVHV